MNLRAPTLDDVPAITELFNKASDELFGETDQTDEEVRLFLTSNELDPAEDIRIAENEDGLVGYADVLPHPHPTYWVDVRVPPSGSGEARRALLDWAVERTREREGEKALAAAWAQDEDEGRTYRAAGFDRVRGSYRMRIDLSDASEEPQLPEGVSVRAMTPDDEHAAHETHEETFQDMWGHAPMTLEDWRHWFVGEEHDWSLWFLAEAEGEVAGVAFCRRDPAEPDTGAIRVLGVRRPFRRRGVGRALLLHVFAELRRRGLGAAILGVDAESLTGAQRLYASAGMHVSRESDIFELELR